MGAKSQGYAANHPYYISLFSFDLFGKLDSIESTRFISPMKFGFPVIHNLILVCRTNQNQYIFHLIQMYVLKDNP